MSHCLLRAQQELDYLNGETVDPVIMDELHLLREHKMDLEDKLNGLQDSRRHLMGQLEGLMRLLKVYIYITYCFGIKLDNLNKTLTQVQQSSPNGTLDSKTSNYSHTGSLHRSAPATPHHSDTYTSLTGELRSAFNNSSEFQSYSNEENIMSRSLRNDLLMAADSVTNAMSTLVNELNSDEDRLESRIMKPLGRVNLI
jgi:hypothetical protein